MTTLKNLRLMLLVLFLLFSFASFAFASLHPSYSPKAEVDTLPFYTGGEYSSSITAPDDHFSFPLGVKAVRYHDLESYIKIIAEQSDRVILEKHSVTHEDRQLYNLYISTPENISKLGDYQAGMDRIADPRWVITDLDNAVASQPAFAWLGYSIHGDELSGTDAGVQLIYHLAAANDSATMHLLENVIIVIDPCENPDGRERYISMLQINESQTPNWDSRAMQHNGVWPWGRTNHYLFDLNRDWILLTQPETRGRVATIVKNHPVLVVDAHEMGPNATYLFSPPRQPINYNTPWNVTKWYEIFNQDQSSAFDNNRWPYYAGEWNDQWYIGYGSAWPTFSGAVGILYEQARVDGEVVRQKDNYLLTFHESINHQFTSSLANLYTTANNRVELIKDYRKARNDIIAKGKKSGLTFIFPPDKDEIKMNRFIESLLGQGIEIEKATSSFSVGSVKDIYKKNHSNKKFPTGTYIIKTSQPVGALAKAILEFDLHLKKEFLDKERRELEKFGETKMYEISAWSVPMLYDLDAYETTSMTNVSTEKVTATQSTEGEVYIPDATYGFIIDMTGEKTMLALNWIFQEELTVFASEKPVTIEGNSFQPGALVLRKRGNPKNLSEILEKLSKEIGINVQGVNTGKPDDGSYLGAGSFRLLRQPRLAMFYGSPLNYTSVGSMWFAIDKQLGIPHSLYTLDYISGMDLNQFNVIILPGSWGSMSDKIGGYGKSKLEEWVENGGTLILEGTSASWAADTSNSFSSVRLRRQSLDKLSDYDRYLKRELAAEAPEVDTMALWHPDKVEKKTENGKDEKEGGDKMSKEEKEDYEKWQRRFRPRGVILRADLDMDQWLSFGMSDKLPVMTYSRNCFLSSKPVNTVARYTSDENNLRLSGLLWPEARERWAGSAYLTQERKGRGQVIMFAGAPNFRAYTYGTRQLLLNADLYGPGFSSYSSPYEQ